jgi:hypothetical protein
VNFFSKFFRSSKPSDSEPAAKPLQLPCGADLWCRKRTSISTMLDPELFDRYKTGDDRIDEEWIIQSNPPCAFRAEFKEGCDALLSLLLEDPGLHATKGWLNFTPLSSAPLEESAKAAYLQKMEIVVRTAERELKPII